MKYTFFLILFLQSSFLFAGETDTSYRVLSSERFTEIKKAMYGQDDWNPIALKQFPRTERIAFYAQSVSEDFVKSYVSFNYKKVSGAFIISKGVDKKLQELMKKTPSREVIYYFLWLLEDSMIEYIGY